MGTQVQNRDGDAKSGPLYVVFMSEYIYKSLGCCLSTADIDDAVMLARIRIHARSCPFPMSKNIAILCSLDIFNFSSLEI